MKKLLAMVLALVMTLSLAVSANAAFKDADKVSADYSEAVAVLNGMDVFKGYEDGSFKPQGNITRAEVATIIYRIYTGDVAKNDKSGLYATYNKFSDMAGAGWAAGYIGYCANAELVKGYPDGTFKPSGNVTGYEVLAMILRAVGYDKNGEFSGADWSLNVAKYAEQLKILKNVDKNTNLGAPATRELVAEILFRAIQQPTVTYTPAFGYVTDKVANIAQTTLAKKNFKLASDDASDVWGRPTTKWYKDANTNEKFDKDEKVYVEIVATPAATYTVATAQCDICKDLGEKNSAKIVEAYTNGVADKTLLTTYKATATTTKVGAQGELLEYYEVKDGYRLVVIDTYLAKVTKVTDAKLDKQGHVRSEAELELNVYGHANRDNITLLGSDGENFENKKDEFVLIYVNDNDVQDSEIVKTVTATAKKYTGAALKANELKLDGEWVKFAEKYAEDEDALKDFGKIDVFYDLYDNVIGTFTVDADKTVVVVDAIYTEGNKKPVFKADLVDTAAETKAYTVDTLTTAGNDKIEVEDIYSRADENAIAFKNDGVYDKLYTYTVNEDETLKVVSVDDSTMGTEASTAISNKDRYVYFTNDESKADKVRFTDETIFLVHENDGTYTSTIGDKMEDITANNIEVMVSKSGYATVVYLFGNIKRVSDVNEVYIPVQDNVYVENQKIDGEYVLCAGITVINADLKESKAWVPVKDLFKNNPEILDLLRAGMSLKKYGVQVGGFFIDAVYLRGTEVLDWNETALAKEDYSLQLVTDVKNGTVTLDDGYKTAFNVNKVKDIYVIENGKITAGTKDDVKADRFVHVFWAADSSYYVADKLYVDLDLTDYVETYNDEIAPLVKAYRDADSANQDAQEELKTAQAAYDAAVREDTDVAARAEDLKLAKDVLVKAENRYTTALDAYNAAMAGNDVNAQLEAAENLGIAEKAWEAAKADVKLAQAAYDAAVKNAAALEAAKAALVKAQAKADAAKKAFDAAKEAVDEFELTNFLFNPYIWDYLDSIN